MRLSELRILRMPGIDRPFSLQVDGLVNLLTGPNGSGKTTICRAVRALLWPQLEHPSPMSLRSRWRHGDASLYAERDEGAPTRWQENDREAATPDLPDSHLAGCYTLSVLDLLKKDADETDTDLAERIRTQMAGGYDTEAVLQAHFAVSKPPGLLASKEARAVEQRQREVLKIKGQRRQLARCEDNLGSMRISWQEALQARARLRMWEIALNLRDAQAALQAKQRALSAFPSLMHRIQGDEKVRLQKLDAQLDEIYIQRNTSAQRIAEMKATLAETSQGETELDADALRHWRQKAHELRLAEQECKQARIKEEGQQQALLVAADQLRSRRDTRQSPEIPAEILAEAESLVAEFSSNAWQREGLRQLAVRLPAAPPSGDPAQISAAMASLQEWLAAPAPLPWWRLWLPPPFILAGALVISGLMPPVLGLDLQGPLASIGLGALVMYWLIGISGSLQRRGRILQPGLQARHLAAGWPSPFTWTRDAVERLLAQLRDDFAAAEAQGIQWRLSEQLRAQQRGLAAQAETLAAERQELNLRVGGDPASTALELLAFVRRTFSYQTERMNLARARGERVQLESRCAADLQAINVFLADCDVDPAADGGEAVRRLDDLESRRSKLAGARDNLAHEQPRLDALDRELARLQQERQGVLAPLGLTTEEEWQLPHLLEQRDPYLTASRQKHELELRLADQARELRSHPDYAAYPDLEKFSRGDLALRLKEDSIIAAKADDYLSDITRIELDIARARDSFDLERALAAEQDARERLREKRAALLQGFAGRYLLGRARARHEREGQSVVMKSAQQLFAAFTCGRYRLVVDQPAGRPASFRARDTSTGRSLSLSELSDGTRAQLLLAARLAFIEAAEPGIRPPLFLDEAIAGSDPERFAAIVRSLLKLVEREGRQLFYLTADPADTAAWLKIMRQEGWPCNPVLDLAEIRQLSAAAGREILDLPEPEPIPDPADQTAASYAEKLRVPPLDARSAPGSIHLFHVLRDDLPLLYRLLRAGVVTVGQWQNLAATLARSDTVTEAQARRIDALCAALVAFLEAWKIGRGSPVDRHVLLESGAVSPTFIDEVAALAGRVGGDGVMLIEALSNKGVENFRRQKTDDLRAYLAAQGFTDARSKLSADDLKVRVIESLHAQLQDHTLEMATIDSLLRNWQESARRAIAPRQNRGQA